MSVFNYNAETKVLTIEVTKAESFEDITKQIPAQKLILRHYRIDLAIKARETAKLEYRRVANIQLGSVVGQTYVIDDDAGFNFFKIGISRDVVFNHHEVIIPADPPAIPDPIVFPAYECQSTVRDCYIPLTMNGPLEKNFTLSVMDNAHNLFTKEEFKYLFLQFECTGGF